MMHLTANRLGVQSLNDTPVSSQLHCTVALQYSVNYSINNSCFSFKLSVRSFNKQEILDSNVVNTTKMC